MSTSEIAAWRVEAEAVPEDKARLGMPMSVLTSEAVNVAAFVRERWEPVVDPATKQVTLPGLRQAVKKGEKGIALRKSLEQDILSLERATQEANVQFLLLSRGGHGDDHTATRGVFVLSELREGLAWLFEDGVTDEGDAALENVEKAHADDGDNLDDLAQALDDFGALAGANREGLTGLEAFDASLIDEAPKLAAALRQPGLRGDKEAVRAGTAARVLRDQLATLLQQRMGRVRAAARYVFRHHPKVLREVTSGYQRSRRAAARRRQTAPTPAPAPAPAP